MKSYVIRIDESIQIPAVVYEIREQARHRPLYVFLEHMEEPNVVRGRFQPLRNPGASEVKRPDGGLSWYHPHTLCLIRADHVDDADRVRHPQFQEEWGNNLMALLATHSFHRGDLSYRDSDVYFNNGVERHLIGLSGWISNGVRVQRACWYETNPVSTISDLLSADGISPARFAQRLHLVTRGFFDYLTRCTNAERVEAEAFISKGSMRRAYALQQFTQGNIIGACVTGRENI